MRQAIDYDSGLVLISRFAGVRRLGYLENTF